MLTGAVAMASTGALLGVGNGAHDQVVGGASGRGAEHAGNEGLDRWRRIDHRLTHLEHGPVRCRTGGNLGSNAGGVADGDGYAGFQSVSGHDLSF